MDFERHQPACRWNVPMRAMILDIVGSIWACSLLQSKHTTSPVEFKQLSLVKFGLEGATLGVGTTKVIILSCAYCANTVGVIRVMMTPMEERESGATNIKYSTSSLSDNFTNHHSKQHMTK
jgi:hypothetical protein